MAENLSQSRQISPHSSGKDSGKIFVSRTRGNTDHGGRRLDFDQRHSWDSMEAG